MRPYIQEVRLGTHFGYAQNACRNLTERAARRSMFGVETYGQPA